MNKEVILYLDELYNDKGKFSVQFNFLNEDGSLGWSKRADWLKARELPKYRKYSTHRTILDVEVVLDLDSKFPLLVKLWFRLLVWRLEHDDRIWQYKAYSTGSRGYHIHMIFHELRDIKSDSLRSKVKQYIIGCYGGELLKGGTNVNIALENVPHFKTGRAKRLVKQKNKGCNQLAPFIKGMLGGD